MCQALCHSVQPIPLFTHREIAKIHKRRKCERKKAEIKAGKGGII